MPCVSDNGSKREQWIDLSKAVAIFLVLLGHAVQYSGKSGVDNPLWSFIYSFHMPLFMFMSGMFAWKSINEPLGKFVCKKFVQLLLPVLCWWLLTSSFLYGKMFSSLSLERLAVAYLWFLKAVFVCQVVMYLLSKISRSSFFLGASVVVLVFLPFSAYEYQLFVYMFPFFLFGNVFNRYKAAVIKYQNTVMFFSLLVFVISYVWWEGKYSIYFSNSQLVHINPLSIDGRATGIYFYRFLIGLSGTVGIMLLCKLVYERFKDMRYMPYVLSIGRNTLGIYIVQSYVVEFLLLRLKLNLSLEKTCIYSFLMALSALLLCWLVILCLDKNRWTRLFLLGKKN